MTKKKNGNKNNNPAGGKKRNQNKNQSKAVTVYKPQSIPAEPEMGRLARALRWGGGLAGGFIHPALAAGGSSLGGMLSKWLGAGDYTVNANSFLKGSSGTIPAMHSNNMSTIVRHKEYITDIITSGTANTFNNQQYAINPGLDSSFPWLQVSAQQYEEYSIKGMVYHFVSTSADALNSTNTALGSVIMCTQYRSTAQSFINKQQMLNEFFCNDSRPSESFCHPIECDPKENPYNVQYIRGGGVPAGEDRKTYDLGTFNIATMGFQGTSVNIGELWVTYEVELKKPVLTSTLDFFGNYAHYSCPTATSAAPLGSGTITNRYDNIGIAVTGFQIAFPLQTVGTYLITVYHPQLTASALPVVTYTNSTAAIAWVGGLTTAAPCVYTVGTAGSNQFSINITNPNLAAIFAFSSWTLTGATTVDVLVVQIPSNYN